MDTKHDACQQARVHWNVHAPTLKSAAPIGARKAVHIIGSREHDEISYITLFPNILFEYSNYSPSRRAVFQAVMIAKRTIW